MLSDDLLFGSRLQAELAGAGHEVTMGVVPDGGADLLVLDLTHDAKARLAAFVGALPALAFYSHVESDVRELAAAAGVEVVVPRSRMAREPAALVARALTTGR